MSLHEAIAEKPKAPRSAPAPMRRSNGARSPYAQAALEDECRDVSVAPEGQRNDRLNAASFSLGQLVGSGALDHSEVSDALHEAARSAGLGESETCKTIASGLAAGEREPRTIPEPRHSGRDRHGAKHVSLAPMDELDASPSGNSEQALAGQPPPGKSFADVFAQWSAEGPLIHESTGIAILDDLTGGGPVYGTRWYVAGAPDGGKTLETVQIGDGMARRGVCVGFLAVDEEPADLVTRFAQRQGWTRNACETRFPSDVERMREHFANLPIRFYGADTTIEQAAADIAALAAERAKADPENHPHGPRAALCIDSLQTVTCDAEVAARLTGRDLPLRQAVTERGYAVRAVASRYRLIALVTSEMNRNAYRNVDSAENTNDLAAGAESRVIEYSGRVLLAVRNVAGEKDLIEVHVAKNKHGPSGERFHLRIDRASQILSEVSFEPKPADLQQSDRKVAAVVADAAVVARALEKQPDIGVRALRAAVGAQAGFGSSRVDTALARLGAAVTRREGTRGAAHLTLNRAALPPEVRAALEANDPA